MYKLMAILRVTECLSLIMDIVGLHSLNNSRTLNTLPHHF